MGQGPPPGLSPCAGLPGVVVLHYWCPEKGKADAPFINSATHCCWGCSPSQGGATSFCPSLVWVAPHALPLIPAVWGAPGGTPSRSGWWSVISSGPGGQLGLATIKLESLGKQISRFLLHYAGDFPFRGVFSAYVGTSRPSPEARWGGTVATALPLGRWMRPKLRILLPGASPL